MIRAEGCKAGRLTDLSVDGRSVSRDTLAPYLTEQRSIMDAHPIHHEPGYETQLGAVDATSASSALQPALRNALRGRPCGFFHLDAVNNDCASQSSGQGEQQSMLSDFLFDVEY